MSKADIDFLRSDWNLMWSRLELDGDSDQWFNKIVDMYTQPERFYHTLDHIQHCIDALDGCPKKALREVSFPAFWSLRLAIYMHDIVYDTKSRTNELDSALWAIDMLKLCRASNDLITCVFDGVMATTHEAHVQYKMLPAHKLLLDIDLSILGASEQVFEEYESQIRQEYQWVPEIVYHTNRMRVLNRFLHRDRIYVTDHFYHLCEKNARTNLTNALGRLLGT